MIRNRLRAYLKRAGAGALLLFGFQNCVGNYQPVGLDDGFSEPPALSNPVVDDTAPPTYGSFARAMRVVGSEFVPIEIDLYPLRLYQSIEVDSLPAGMTYNATTRRLSWLPRKGQAGTWLVFVRTLANNVIETRYIEFEITSLSADYFRFGPPDLYKDSDVGYVFVHGAGDRDRCSDFNNLQAYWGGSIALVAPDANNRHVACYDGRLAVAQSSAGVAHQILNAPCGRYDRCIIITHSMGGLMMEHMFTHAREARAGDPAPESYNNNVLYKKVRDKTLFVISLGSAAGGSKSASIVEAPERYPPLQYVVGGLSNMIGQDDAATHNLEVSTATRVVVPVNEDPQVPFFMIPGYSVKRLQEVSNTFGGVWDYALGRSAPYAVFQGNSSLAVLDDLTEFYSRSDGLVDFRSSCGVASTNQNEGPGIKASLSDQFRYCFSAIKKPNHYVWFLTSLNHYLMTLPYTDCTRAENPCVSSFPDFAGQTFVQNPTYYGKSAMHVLRARLTANRNGLSTQPLRLKMEW